MRSRPEEAEPPRPWLATRMRVVTRRRAECQLRHDHAIVLPGSHRPPLFADGLLGVRGRGGCHTDSATQKETNGWDE